MRRTFEKRSPWIAGLLGLVLGACGNEPPAPPTPAPEPARVSVPTPPEPSLEVFAAASLREVMAALGDAFQAKGKPEVRFNFAGSNVLAQQLLASSRGEVFVSADEQWVAHVETHGGAVPGTRAVVASNTLVVVAHPSSTYALAAITELPALAFAHLSLADPAAVPAGRYAKAYLESVPARRGTVWSAVRARVAPGADVRAALAVVATQEDVVGIVYRTDARAARVRVLLDVPPETLPSPVRYTAVAVNERLRVPLAREFIAFLTSPEGQAIFAAHGFLPPPAAAPTSL